MKQTKQARVLALSSKGLKPKDIAVKAKCSLAYVYNTLSENKNGKSSLVTNLEQKKSSPIADNVNHPSHYKTGGIETIDFIEAKKLDYHLGNVVKYITRADLKGNKLEDLQKAQWYLNRAISNLTK